MAFDSFMWLEGGNPAVQGETTDTTYKAKNAFEIYSFSWGASNPTTVGSGSTGLAAGKVSISSFNIMKKSEKSSPTLFSNCCNGTHFTKATVVLRKAGGTKAVVFLEYDFEDVLVESVQWSGSSGGDDTPTESVSFAFGKVTVQYTPQADAGTPGKLVSGSWNIQTNEAK